MSIYPHHMLARNAVREPLTPFLKQMDDRESRVLKKEEKRIKERDKAAMNGFALVSTGAGAAVGGVIGGPLGAVAGGAAAGFVPGFFAVAACCNDRIQPQWKLNEWRVQRLSDKISDIDERMKSAASSERSQLRKARDYFENNHKMYFRNMEVTHKHYHY